MPEHPADPRPTWIEGAVRRLWTAAGRAGCGRQMAQRGPTRPPYSGSVSLRPYALPGRPTAAFFDLDKTIIAKSSTLAFSKPFQAGGLISRRAVLRSAYAQFVYLVGGADHDQMEKMREFMSQLCAGWDVATVARDRRRHPAQHRRPAGLRRGREPDRAAPARRPRHRHRLHVSGAEVVEPIGEMLGADRVIATRLEIVDGHYTGEIEYYAYAEEKARAIRPTSPVSEGYDLDACYAYSDSVTDVPCSRRSATRTPSTPTRSCAGSPPPGAGRCWSSTSRWRCAAGCRCRLARPPWRRSRSAGALAVGGLSGAAPRRRRLEGLTDTPDPTTARKVKT